MQQGFEALGQLVWLRQASEPFAYLLSGSQSSKKKENTREDFTIPLKFFSRYAQGVV